ncbi:TonB-dependent siderophore receptor [Methylocystis heyeri]|uniref:TonB-dependent siderophore receptor n=2 Tax=Methylocystis heyeri TaxID=391905 RepID=A0A6B8KEH8_9HYPH|nr:TonB-dependent siderophore receptor [Methylocystis heyeri]
MRAASLFLRICPVTAPPMRRGRSLMKTKRLFLEASLAAIAAAAVVVEARAQESLPMIDVGAEKVVQGAPPGPAGGDGGGTGGAGGNGTSIGIGNNGEMCAGDICNNPKSYAAPVQSIGTKVNTPAIETPLSTKTVTNQMLEDQQVTSIEQALRNVSGVYFSGGGGSSFGYSFGAVVLRGFPTSTYYRDGVRLDTYQGGTSGIGGTLFANVENVEVLKGPAAILYGAVEPGGIVNLNLKQPLEKPAYSIQQQVGSYQSYRTVLDATGPLSADKSLLYRFIASYENDGSFQDYGYNRNVMFYPVVKWNVDNNTWIRVSDQYQENRINQVFLSYLTYNNVLPLWLGRSWNPGPPSPDAQKQNFATVTWHHDFDKDWSVQQNFLWQTVNHTYTQTGAILVSDCISPGGYCGAGNFTGAFLPGNAQLVESGYPSFGTQQTYVTNLDVVGHVKTGELQHTMLLGADYYRYNGRLLNTLANSFGSLTVFGTAPATTPSLYAPSAASGQQGDNVGAYIQDQIKLPYDFEILAGGRYQYVNSRFQTTTDDTCGYPNNYGLSIPCVQALETMKTQTVNQRVTPRAALLWRPYEWMSLYGNYVESYSPNYNGYLVLGSNLPNPPSAGQQEEAGVKFQFFDQRLQAQLAYYHLVKTNIPVGIPNDQIHEILVGQGRSQGLEIDIGGEIMPGWSVNLAYANTDALVTKASPFGAGYNPAIGSPFPYVPRNQGSIASSYEFRNGSLQGLKVGARYDYTGYLPFFHYNNDGTYIYGQGTPSYGLVGVFAGYDFLYNGYNIHTQLNVDNLFDKTYYLQGGLVPMSWDQLSSPQAGWSLAYQNNSVLGTPRTIRGLIKVSF